MNNFYIIWEDNHGNIAITDSYDKAIDFLLDDEWISVPANTTQKWYKDYLKSLTYEEFNDKMYNEMNYSYIVIQECHFENGIWRAR